MNATTRVAALLGAAFLAVPSPAQEEHLLKFSYQEGKTQYYLQTQEARMKMDMGGMNMDTTMTLELTIEFKVGAVKDGAAEVSQTITRLKVKTDNPMMTIDYDSDDPESDAGPMGSMTGMVGKPFIMKIDGSGKVTDLKAPEGLDAGAMGGGMDQFFRNLPQLPGKPQAVGATWETSTTMPNSPVGKGEVKVTNRLAKVEAGKAHIEQTMQLDADKLDVPEGAKVKIERATGTSVLDLATGLIRDTSSDIAMKMTGEQGGMKMDMDMTMRMRMTAIDKPAPKKKPEAKPGEPGKEGEGKKGG